MKTGNLVINWPLLSYTTFHTERLPSSNKIRWQGDFQSSNFQIFSDLGKNWKCSLVFSKIPVFHPFYEWGKTDQDQHFKIQILNLWMNLEKLCPNLSFTVKNKIGNSHKKWRRVRDWPSGLTCCNQNWKIPSSNPERYSAGLKDPPRFETPGTIRSKST